MTSALVTHEACLMHEPPDGHPERPARLRAVLKGLEQGGLDCMAKIDAREASLEMPLRVHSRALVEQILGPLSRLAQIKGHACIDADTYMSPKSAEAALVAAGAVTDAVDCVMAGEVRNAFCAVRPPGHHAERGRAMGFCLFNNVAIGALHAHTTHGLTRVAVVDFDVHHGNGTQDVFFNDANLFYASSHQAPLYPGTGYENESGVANNIVNRRLAPGSGSAEFRAIYRDSILPALEEFAPEFIFISAGFDAHRSDPLANLNLTEDDFAWVTSGICAVADRVCAGRVVSTLEGGYDLEALACSTAAHVRALMEG